MMLNKSQALKGNETFGWVFVGLHKATSWTTGTGRNTEVYVSFSTVSRVLITWYHLLAANLKHLIVWPSKEVIATNMPDCFKKFPTQG